MSSTDSESNTNNETKVVVHEFNMCVLGISGVGKTSLMKRLTSGTAFNRKTSCKPSLEDESTKYSIEYSIICCM